MTLWKKDKVKYLQDYITAFQDQAWGNGEFLLNYKCSPGIPVDEYQLGHNTYKLISLREVRNKGDVDEFNITWNMKNGFLKSTVSLFRNPLRFENGCIVLPGGYYPEIDFDALDRHTVLRERYIR